MGILDRISASRLERRYSADTYLSEYIQPFLYGGNTYGVPGGNGLVQTLAGNRASEIVNTLPGYAAALRQCPPAFAAELIRAMVLSQARFTFRNLPSARSPRKTFGTTALSPLEKPWDNATTGELIARCEWHAGLAGNAYVVRQAKRLRVLRPDWVAILYGSDQEPEDAAHALDGTLLGYVYGNGGLWGGGNMPQTILPPDMAHWCADEETTILTADGWKDYRSLTAGDEVLTLNIETGLSEWQQVQAMKREQALDELARKFFEFAP